MNKVFYLNIYYFLLSMVFALTSCQQKYSHDYFIYYEHHFSNGHILCWKNEDQQWQSSVTYYSLEDVEYEPFKEVDLSSTQFGVVIKLRINNINDYDEMNDYIMFDISYDRINYELPFNISLNKTYLDEWMMLWKDIV